MTLTFYLWTVNPCFLSHLFDINVKTNIQYFTHGFIKEQSNLKKKEMTM